MKILKGNCEMIALMEAALYGTGKLMRIAPVGTNTRTFEIQREFKPVVFVNSFELVLRDGLHAVKMDFDYNLSENVARIHTTRRGIDVLQEIFPDTFSRIKGFEDDKKEEERDIEVKPYTKLASA